MGEEGVPVSVQQTYKSLADQLQERGEKRGEKRGEQRGLAIGEQRGKAKALLAVLGARALPVPSAIEARILGCDDPELLDRWLRRAVAAQTVEELFDEG